MAVILKDIGKRARASVTAVSMVINDKNTEHVGPERRNRILKALEELNYHPHAVARSLVLNKTYTIGISLYEIGYITQSYFAAIIAGMEEVIGPNDYNLSFAVTCKAPTESGNQNLYFLRKAMMRALDGLIIVDQAIEEEEILKLRKAEIPFVMVDRRLSTNDNNFCVRVDNADGIFQAVNHFAELGHKRIGFIAEPHRFNKTKEMIKGYKLGHEKHELLYDEKLICYASGKGGITTGEEIKEDVRPLVQKLLDYQHVPTAIVTSGDLIALAVLKIFKEMKIRVPEDIALIGYNDEFVVSNTTPELSSVRVPLKEMGKLAAEVLINLLKNSKVDDGEIILKPELVIRESSQGRR